MLGDGVRLIRIDIHTGAVKRTFEPLRDDLRGFDMVRSSADGHLVAQFGNIASAQAPNGVTGVFGIYDTDTGERVVPRLSCRGCRTMQPSTPTEHNWPLSGAQTAKPMCIACRKACGWRRFPRIGFSRCRRKASQRGLVAYAPDGRLFVGSEIGDLRVLDPETYKVVQSFPERGRLANLSLTFSPDGSVLLAISGFDGHVSRLDPSTGTVLWGGESSPRCGSVVFVPRSTRFYCGQSGIREYDVDSGQPTGAVLTENGTSDSDLVVMDDGNELVAFGGLSPIVAHWRIDGGGPIDHLLTSVRIPASTATYPTASLSSGTSMIRIWSTPSRAQSSIV